MSTIDIKTIFDLRVGLGSGGSGQVWFARLRGSDSVKSNSYALKEISLSSADTIARECDILYNLRGNEHVIELLACIVCNEGPTVYLVLDYFETSPFREYVHNITDEEMRAYMAKILSGVEFIHFRNIVHRDLKPDNVLFNRNSKHLKIIDFGIGCYQHDTAKICDGGGTYGYRAPELLLGVEQPTFMTDIWAVGQILVCLLTGIEKWFLYAPDIYPSPSIQQDDFTLAQLCSLFGCDAMIKCASSLHKALSVVYPWRDPLFPQDTHPITSIISLRSDDSRFSITMWDIVAKCYQLSMKDRSSAGEALKSLKGSVMIDSEGGCSKSTAFRRAFPTFPTSVCYTYGRIEILDRKKDKPQPPYAYNIEAQHWPYFFNFKAKEHASPLPSPFKTVAPQIRSKRPSDTTAMHIVSAKKICIELEPPPQPPPPRVTDAIDRLLLATTKEIAAVPVVPAPRKRIATGVCNLCRCKFYGKEEEHVKGDIHRENFDSKVARIF